MKRIETAVIVPAYNEERLLPLTLQGLYEQNNTPDFTTILVDNGSTDHTREVAEDFRKEHSDFNLIITEEGEKGTGRAVSHGFSLAINKLGAKVLARTDADTVPAPTWLESATQQLSKPKKQMATGPITALQDEHYKPMDSLIVPAIEIIGRVSKAALSRHLAFLKAAPGANSAVKADAYEKVGGYAKTSIEQLDEDSDLALKIAEEFGFAALSYDRHMKVSTSARRLRAIGLGGMAACYVFSPNNTQTRLDIHNGDVDIR